LEFRGKGPTSDVGGKVGIENRDRGVLRTVYLQRRRGKGKKLTRWDDVRSKKVNVTTSRRDNVNFPGSTEEISDASKKPVENKRGRKSNRWGGP